jgi:hypothetical protein
MSIRGVFVGLLGIFGHASTACANSCANVDVIGTFDQSGLQESEFGINAVGTFRIAGETDESKQPMFNFATIDCEKQSNQIVKASLQCKVTKAIVWAKSGNPDVDNPNCSLDLDVSVYSMKELNEGVISGIDTSTTCYNTILTIDRNNKRVYASFTPSEYAESYDKIKPGICGTLPRTQVLMNCTAWPRLRTHGKAPPRYCDYSNSAQH